MSSEQNEVDKFRKMGLDIETHRRKMVQRNLEKEFKAPDNPFRMVIVCAMWITGFDAQCVSTVYLDKPIKGHTLMQTIARANRVFDDEKERGLIVDYGNVYKQLEKAYAIYGEGSKGKDGNRKKDRPVEELEELAAELGKAINQVRQDLTEVNFELSNLIEADSMEKIGRLKEAADCVCLNETTRTSFEMKARNVFRKYNALYPEKQIKPFLKDYNAIEAIYNQLHQRVKDADVTEIIMELQAVVNDSVMLKADSTGKDEVFIDLSRLDVEKLKAAFANAPRKNTLTYDLQKAIEKKLQQMLKENPLRLEFYERYQEIIKDYNKDKSLENTILAFEKLIKYVKGLEKEEQRVMKENLEDQETLAIFDLLCAGKDLSEKDRKQVKKVAKKTLDILKAEKLKIGRWRESRQITAQVKKIIKENLLWLPQEAYSDEELSTRTVSVYQHIYSSYYGDGQSVYQQSA